MKTHSFFDIYKLNQKKLCAFLCSRFFSMRLIGRQYYVFGPIGLGMVCIEKDKAILSFDICVKFIDNP